MDNQQEQVQLFMPTWSYYVNAFWNYKYAPLYEYVNSSWLNSHTKHTLFMYHTSIGILLRNIIKGKDNNMQDFIVICLTPHIPLVLIAEQDTFTITHLVWYECLFVGQRRMTNNTGIGCGYSNQMVQSSGGFSKMPATFKRPSSLLLLLSLRRFQ